MDCFYRIQTELLFDIKEMMSRTNVLALQKHTQLSLRSRRSVSVYWMNK